MKQAFRYSETQEHAHPSPRNALLRCLALAVALCLACSPGAQAAAYRFEVKFSPNIRSEPFSGRVYLFFTRHEKREPRLAARGAAPDWFHPEPFLAVDIENWKPGETLTIDPSIADWMLSFPKPLAQLDLDKHRVQAVARFNPLERVVAGGAGNGFGPAVEIAADGLTKLAIDKLVEAAPFPENRWCRLLRVPSPRLSGFHHREMTTQGAVLLPASYYDEPARRYPVIFTVPGFGGTHRDRIPTEPIREKNAEGVEFIRVVLDPSCPLGHHVFADSANNGPVGMALVSEFIPELDRQYRTAAAPRGRFLTGHSSGGWSTLWLQIAYPETFGGTWSTAPDAVDFHDFQRIDIYRAGENMYRDASGARRPLAHSGDQILLWFDAFDRMEHVLGPGGQLHSFEAVFGGRGRDGLPIRAWSRKNGAVDAAAVEHWKGYDIRRIVETRWNELGPKLRGKLHIIMGDQDTFYLEGATKRLKETLEKLGSDAVVEIVPGKDHFTLSTPELLARIRGEMVQAWLK